ncbi:MAG: tRNA uridine(34) 5-carboxymethylaminomethyl modification radical SAM/GNAT enzyme Elp3 [bacterium]
MKNVLLAIVKTLYESHPKTQDELLHLKKDIAGTYKISPPSSATLLKAYQKLVQLGELQNDDFFMSLLRRKSVRSNSGIAPITVLTKPYPCPGKCTYCPTEVTMPKSYLSNEPAAQRALMNRFDPYKQMVERIKALSSIGHDAHKIELIVKGGTWSAYPASYQRWFIKRCFDGANHASGARKRSSTLLEAQNTNENADHRIIGITLETRPDFIKPKEVARLRSLGCTRVEIGLQHTSNIVLAKVKRGHTAEDCMQALALLRDAGFKTDLHMMPQLPGSDAKQDVAAIAELFENPSYRPDMIKIYPCVVTPNSELYEDWKNGKFVTYSEPELFEALLAMKQLIPRYCRISRLVRDIPKSSILAGNNSTNMRDILQREMKKRGTKCACLRCREISHQKEFASQAPVFFDDKYEASNGIEHFLSMETEGREAVFAFCRLRLGRRPQAVGRSKTTELEKLIPEIRGAAFIRELHTYGVQLGLGERDAGASQHKGLGKKLMEKSEEIARTAGYKKLAVISGIGVRAYYRKLGYRRVGSYMVKYL